jgi:hypothetical protein
MSKTFTVRLSSPLEGEKNVTCKQLQLHVTVTVTVTCNCNCDSDCDDLSTSVPYTLTHGSLRG